MMNPAMQRRAAAVTYLHDIERERRLNRRVLCVTAAGYVAAVTLLAALILGWLP